MPTGGLSPCTPPLTCPASWRSPGAPGAHLKLRAKGRGEREGPGGESWGEPGSGGDGAGAGAGSGAGAGGGAYGCVYDRCGG